MKLIYSHLKTFLPDLNIAPQKLRDDLTMIGHFCNFYEEIEGEIVFDLDIKVNRGDCLGYYGLARDLSILYDLPLVLPQPLAYPTSNYSLPIQATSPDVTRVMSLKIVHVKNTTSPVWLKKFCEIHKVNSINTIVDLTNYVMFMYGLPNHAFDTSKSTDNLIWENNHGKSSKFTTLDGTTIDLYPENLVISNRGEVLSTDLVGGRNSGIEINTTNTIIEVAIYNNVRIRLDSRKLKIVTEASTRLEKDLDPELIPNAINRLAQLIIENCGGTVGSQVFDYYPHPVVAPVIDFDPKLPSKISGITIPEDFATDIVAKVGHRPDITLPEDLAEEVIRFYGYNHIPTDQPLISKDVPNVTPKILYLIEETKDKLVAEGYDEVLTWPLVGSPVDPQTVIKTENSINDEIVYLRQSLIPSLKHQLIQYQKYKLPHPKFFEIGKIFSQQNGQYIEKFALGTYDGQNFSETILDDQPLPDNYVPQSIRNTAIELTSQIITLDANVELIGPQDPLKLIGQYSALIDPKILWSMEITDIFKEKYTFRVHYFNCDDKTAKKIHLKTFNLDKI